MCAFGFCLGECSCKLFQTFFKSFQVFLDPLYASGLGPAPQWAAPLVVTMLCPPQDYLQAEDGHVRAEAFVLNFDHTDDGVQSRGVSEEPKSGVPALNVFLMQN